MIVQVKNQYGVCANISCKMLPCVGDRVKISINGMGMEGIVTERVWVCGQDLSTRVVIEIFTSKT